MLHLIVVLCASLPVVLGHFQLNYPAARGYAEDTQGTFPCGGQDTISSNRTQWPLSGGPIQLNMKHQLTNVQVLIALGNDPGSDFDLVLDPTFVIQGIGQFCLSNVSLPSGVNVTSGSNATIQVVSNNEAGGGLYNCADITFTDDSLSNGQCQNSTGITATAFGSPAANANTSSTSDDSTSTKNWSARMEVNAWVMVIGGALGFSALL